MAQNRQAFPDLFLADALPAIRDIIMNESEQHSSMLSQVFNVESSNRAIEQSTGISGLGRFIETAEGASHAQDLFYQRFDVTYEHNEQSLGFSVTRVMVEDDEVGMVPKLSKELGFSAFDTKEVDAAALYNDAFAGATFTGGDGQPLCDTAHVLVSGTEQNELTTAADLSVASFKQAVNDLEDTVNERGLKINVKGSFLLTANENEFTAHEMLNSVGLPDTANNNTNSLSAISGLRPAVWTYITDPDAWFIIGSKHDVNWYDRVPLQVLNYMDDPTGNMVVYGRMRYSRGFNDWRGIFGSPGA